MGGILNILVQFVGTDEFLELLAMVVSGLFEVDIGISYDPYRTAEGCQLLQQGRQLSKEQLANTLRASPVNERLNAASDPATEVLKGPRLKPSVNLWEVNSQLRGECCQALHWAGWPESLR